MASPCGHLNRNIRVAPYSVSNRPMSLTESSDCKLEALVRDLMSATSGYALLESGSRGGAQRRGGGERREDNAVAAQGLVAGQFAEDTEILQLGNCFSEAFRNEAWIPRDEIKPICMLSPVTEDAIPSYSPIPSTIPPPAQSPVLPNQSNEQNQLLQRMSLLPIPCVDGSTVTSHYQHSSITVTVPSCCLEPPPHPGDFELSWKGSIISSSHTPPPLHPSPLSVSLPYKSSECKPLHFTFPRHGCTSKVDKCSSQQVLNAQGPFSVEPVSASLLYVEGMQPYTAMELKSDHVGERFMNDGSNYQQCSSPITSTGSSIQPTYVMGDTLSKIPAMPLDSTASVIQHTYRNDPHDYLAPNQSGGGEIEEESQIIPVCPSAPFHAIGDRYQPSAVNFAPYTSAPHFMFMPPLASATKRSHAFFPLGHEDFPLITSELCPPLLPNSQTPRRKAHRSRRKRANGEPAEEGIHQGMKLWQFLLEVLVENKNQTIIRWTSKQEGMFKVIDSEGLAKLWGEHKNRPEMNYDKMSRAMRYYYNKNLLDKVPRRLYYQFRYYSKWWERLQAVEPDFKMNRLPEAPPLPSPIKSACKEENEDGGSGSDDSIANSDRRSNSSS